jgi:hypothetical protein
MVPRNPDYEGNTGIAVSFQCGQDISNLQRGLVYTQLGGTDLARKPPFNIPHKWQIRRAHNSQFCLPANTHLWVDDRICSQAVRKEKQNGMTWGGPCEPNVDFVS